MNNKKTNILKYQIVRITRKEKYKYKEKLKKIKHHSST